MTLKQKTLRPVVFLIIFFFVTLSLSQKATHTLRALSVSTMAPFSHPKKGNATRRDSTLAPHYLERLQLENDLMRTEIQSLQEWILYEGKKGGLQTELQEIQKAAEENEFYLRRSKELVQRLSGQKQAVLGKVIFREPVSWSSALWLDVGKRDNARLQQDVIAKNSPVVLGASLVGLVEQVEEGKCRVRLISDSNLVPSVRAVRGRQQYRTILHQLETLLTNLQLIKGGLGDNEEDPELRQVMALLKKKWQGLYSEAYLAKGELHGSAAPLWRSRGNLLKGIGFNYDFADEEGPPRELRSSSPPLLQVGDLLVTTGFDGVFPPNLQVGIIQEVSPLKEGASSYELKAHPTAGNLSHLETLFVLPPLNP